MKFPQIAAAAVRIVEKVPTLVWAGWIVAVVAAVAILALRTRLL